MSTRSNRRQFLQTSAAAAAAGAWWFNTDQAVALNFVQPNDRPRVGCIGTGDRWNDVGNRTMEFGDVLAVCDVDKAHVDKAQKRVKEKQNREVEGYEDYRKLLERNDIDVVTIITPDHWHSKIAIEAMKAGKDVYCEKPLTLTIDEGKQILKVLNETKRVFQVGTQQRSEMPAKSPMGNIPAFLLAVGILRDGRIGKIEKVQCAIGGVEESGKLPKVSAPETLNWEMWLGQAPLVDYVSGPKPERGYAANRCHYNFRWWYEYSGGKMTDWGAHHVDIAQWGIEMDKSGPTLVTPVHVKHPCDYVDGNPTADDMYNVATEFMVKANFPNGVEVTIRHDTENGITFSGTEGELFVGRGKIRGAAVDALKDKPLPEGWMEKLYNGKKPDGGNAHMANFFDCVKTRETPISDVYTHHRAMTTCHLANIAMRLNRPVKWNPETEQIEDDKQAAAMQAREQRKGYEIVT